MATIRRPLSTKPVPLNLGPAVSPFAAKRARSPDGADTPHSGSKRQKAAPSPAPALAPAEREKDRRRAEREAQKEEFRLKYRKAFPSWIFYFNVDVVDGEKEAVRTLQARVLALGGSIDDFFSSEITHVVTNLPMPTEGGREEDRPGKENAEGRLSQEKSGTTPRSPSKRSRQPSRHAGDDVMQHAVKLKLKIWNLNKLESVLDRCDAPAPATASSLRINDTSRAAPAPAQRSLKGLLESERRGGLLDRDPTQRRHDYKYFSKGSYFVLVEDINQQLAPIAALEYPVTRDRSGNEHGDWPVLHCHPHARGPFIEFNEREKRKWEKQERAEAEREQAHADAARRSEERRRRAEQERRAGNLRRTVSLANLRRAGHEEVELFDDGEAESALASGYIAASGNSVGITSTTGTTSANGGMRGLQLSTSLQAKVQRQIVTSRKFGAEVKEERETSAGAMGPPAAIPERRQVLKKAKSTNTLRLPRRDEGVKPGYCESCRLRFDDFTKHTNGSRHRKYAQDDANFAHLDAVLARVTRRTLADIAAEQESWEESRLASAPDEIDFLSSNDDAKEEEPEYIEIDDSEA